MAKDMPDQAEDARSAAPREAQMRLESNPKSWQSGAVSAPVELSVVIAAKNEAEAIVPLLEEIVVALEKTGPAEIIVVDDGSTDDMVARLTAFGADEPRLRVIRHRNSCGQSTAIRTGVLAASGELIVTLDGDGQNDPADIPAMVASYRASEAKGVRMAAGHRRNRRDTLVKRVSSKIANGVRRRLLGDGTPDTGCGLKVFDRATFLRLPYFDHMHRFLPALVQREGHGVVIVPVNHRERSAGQSKYGTLDRLWVGIWDLMGVAWLKSRSKHPEIVE